MRYIHITTGKKYKVLFHAILENTLEPSVIYQSLTDGAVWVRPAKDFYDGRFKLFLEDEQ